LTTYHNDTACGGRGKYRSNFLPFFSLLQRASFAFFVRSTQFSGCKPIPCIAASIGIRVNYVGIL